MLKAAGCLALAPITRAPEDQPDSAKP